MELLIDHNALAALFRERRTFIDVRSPGEFQRAHLPNSLNAPLLTDAERAAVGLEYRLQGAESAIALGHSLVKGEIKDLRIAEWQRCAEAEHASLLFCARGGLRSQIACSWLAERGTSVTRILGGYKALRRGLLGWFDAAVTTLPLLVVSGQTGAGKTRFLNSANHHCSSIDLEALAHHCGSSFGAIFGPQPTQATFENYLFVAAINATEPPILIEDESRRIGAITLPPSLLSRIADSPRIVLVRPLEERVEFIKEDYVLSVLARTPTADRTIALCTLERSLTEALQRIGKRLGDQRLRVTSALLQAAFEAHRNHDDSTLHNRWIELLLNEYYDPSYLRQLSNHRNTIVAEGTEPELLNALKNRTLPPLRSAL